MKAPVYSNIQGFQEPYIQCYGFFGHFVKLFEGHIRYYMVAVARNFEFTASNIEVTHSPYSILDGPMSVYSNLRESECRRFEFR